MSGRQRCGSRCSRRCSAALFAAVALTRRPLLRAHQRRARRARLGRAARFVGVSAGAHGRAVPRAAAGGRERAAVRHGGRDADRDRRRDGRRKRRLLRSRGASAAAAVDELSGHRVRVVQDWIAGRGFLAVLYARILPLMPFTPRQLRRGPDARAARVFAAATAIGCAPRAFAWVALGGSLADLGSAEAIDRLRGAGRDGARRAGGGEPRRAGAATAGAGVCPPQRA